MATTAVTSPTTRGISLWQIVGLCLFVLAFFLPAVADGASTFRGYQCAEITFGWLFQSDTYTSLRFLAALSGLINPLIAFYLLFGFVPTLRVLTSLDDARRLIAVAVLACMAATWILFVLEKIVPLLGHILWIVGALMILSAEVRSRRAAPAAAGA